MRNNERMSEWIVVCGKSYTNRRLITNSNDWSSWSMKTINGKRSVSTCTEIDVSLNVECAALQAELLAAFVKVLSRFALWCRTDDAKRAATSANERAPAQLCRKASNESARITAQEAWACVSSWRRRATGLKQTNRRHRSATLAANARADELRYTFIYVQ